MYREIFTHPHIGSYSAMLLAGFIAAWLLARWRARRNQIEGRHIDNLVLLLLVICPMGARFFSRLFDFVPFIGFWEALKLWKSSGLVFYGGMIFGVMVVIVYAAIMKISLLQLGDVLAPSLALGLAFGRVGCFLSGCCWGDVCVTPRQLVPIKSAFLRHQLQTFPALSPPNFFLALKFPPESGAYEQHQKLGLISSDAAHSLPVHPTQLYEAALVLGLCLFLNFVFNRRRAQGEIIAAFAFGYGIIRFTVEFFRADTPPIYSGMSISQVLSIGLAGLGVILFVVIRKFPKFDRSRQSVGKVTEIIS